jgi:uncharacterized protein YijF (DUF1287 family)
MAERIRKKRYRRSIDYKYIIYVIVFIALLQLLILKIYYQEEPSKLPEKLFLSKKDFPISELILDITKEELESVPLEDTDAQGDDAADTDENSSNELGSLNLTDIQKDITLRILELLDEDIEYGMEYFPNTYYPSTDNKWISTDVISVTLNDCGIDIMELIYKDMLEHKEDYPIDTITGRKTAIKYIDSRNVFFQERFFERNALILPVEYDIEDENRNLIWQAGDIVYFQIDKDDPDSDHYGGLISPHKNEDGVPLVIMISSEFKKVSEVDVLLEYKIAGHFRYPAPEVD